MSPTGGRAGGAEARATRADVPRSLMRRQYAQEVGALFARVSLGSSMLLASHCIVITHYLLDSILHQVPPLAALPLIQTESH